MALLKKRLRTDNPQKQWLAVQLVGRVMRDCSAAIGLHTEELLQDVARVMARPARPESEAGGDWWGHGGGRTMGAGGTERGA